MPTILRQSGPKFEKDGVIHTPKAMVHFCEGCNAPDAPFLIWDGKTMLSYCGRVEGKPVCVKPYVPGGLK